MVALDDDPLPAAENSCTLNTTPCVTWKVRQALRRLRPMLQRLLLATWVRAFTLVPVYAARSVVGFSATSETCKGDGVRNRLLDG